MYYQYKASSLKYFAQGYFPQKKAPKISVRFELGSPKLRALHFVTELRRTRRRVLKIYPPSLINIASHAVAKWEITILMSLRSVFQHYLATGLKCLAKGHCYEKPRGSRPARIQYLWITSQTLYH